MLTVFVSALAVAAGSLRAQEAAKPSHIVMTSPELVWGDLPPVFEPGGKLAVVSGDPGKEGPFVVRVQLPAGYKVMPHWHPADENLTMLSGTCAIGMGEKWDSKVMQDLPPGSYLLMPAEMRHFFLAKTATTFQVHGMGPLVLTYVNPADDPSQRAKPAAKP